MPFLDMLVEYCESGICIRTCRKPMHAGIYGNWSSFIPWHYERNCAKSFLKQAYEVASSYRITHEYIQGRSVQKTYK